MLMGYAAGALPEAFDLVVASHISMCDDCRAKLAAYDAVGGAVIDTAEAAELTEDSFTCDAAPDRGQGSRRTSRLLNGAGLQRGGVLPAPLQAYVGGDLEAVKLAPSRRWRLRLRDSPV